MRIALIAGCLEPGQDGVGDYARRLATECERLGHQVALLSVAEKHSSGNPVAEPISTLRLTSAEWRGDGGQEARRWLDTFRPDWVSLQFVPYSFDPRGLFAASIGAFRTTLGGATNRHIFFHEIWIGSYQGAPLRARLTGFRQKKAVRRLLQAIEPRCVHTNTGYHRDALATIGQPARILPLFGNVPVPIPAAAAAAIALPGVDPAALVCGMFGSLDPGWAAEKFLQDFAMLATSLGKPVALVAAGGLGLGAKRFNQIAEEWREKVACVAVGRCAEAELARLFARFDFGVTSVPWNIVGKSGSAAALREHGLRVVVTTAGSPPRFASSRIDGVDSDPGFVAYFRDRNSLPSALQRSRPQERAPIVAEQFLADLHAAE